MSQYSLLGSNQSIDGDVLVDTGIKCLIEQCFDMMKPFDELYEAIYALVQVTQQRESFSIKNLHIQHECIRSILNYTIEMKISPISFKDSDSKLYAKSKELIYLIAAFVLRYKKKDQSIFINELLISIYNVLQNKDFKLPSVTIQKVNIKSGKYDQIPTIEILLQILDKILKHSIFDERNLLEIISNCLFAFNTELSIQYLAIKILSHNLPFSPNNSYLQFRILINYIYVMYTDIVEPPEKALFILQTTFSEKSDYYIERGIQNSLFNLSENFLLIFGRETIEYLPKLSTFSGFHFMNSIFFLIDKYLSLDTVINPIVPSSFLKSFEYFFENETFLNLCLKLTKYNEQFTNSLMNTYINTKHSIYLPYLFRLNRYLFDNYLPKIHQIYGQSFYKSIPNSIVYQILTELNKHVQSVNQFNSNLVNSTSINSNLIQQNYLNSNQFDDFCKYFNGVIVDDKMNVFIDLLKYFKKLMLKKFELPDRSLILDLIQISSNECLSRLFEYDIDTIYSIISQPNIYLNQETNEKVIELAVRQKPFPIISHFINEKPETDRFDELLKLALSPDQQANYFELFENDTFLTSLICRFKSRVTSLIPDLDIFINHNKLKCLLTIASNKFTSILFIEKLIKAMTYSKECSNLFCVLKNIPKNVLNYVLDQKKFELSVTFFDLISAQTPTEIEYNEREYRFKALSQILYEKKTNNHFFKELSKSLIPVLIVKNDLKKYSEYINKYKQLSQPDKNWEEQFWKDIIANVFIYLFGYNNKEYATQGIKFIQKITNKHTYNLVIEYKSKILPTFLLYLGHPENDIRMHIEKNLAIIGQIYEKTADLNEILARFWSDSEFLSVIYNFSCILNDHSEFSKEMVINSLIGALEYIKGFVKPFLPKITSLIDTAFKYPNLRIVCLNFWSKFLEVNSKEIIESLFGHIITQILPFFEFYKNPILLILKKLFEIKDEYIEVARLKEFYKYPELSEYSKILQKQIKKIDFKDQLNILRKESEQASSNFRTYLFDQILQCLKENIDQIRTQNIITKKLVKYFSKQLIHETDSTLQAKISQILCILPELEKQTDDKNNIEELDKNDLIQILISDYLVKVLEDSSDLSYHDHAAYAIQELLKLIKKKKLSEFPENVLNVIKPFQESKYKYTPSPSTIEVNEPISMSVDSIQWVSKFTTRLLNIAKSNNNKNSDIFYCLQCVLGDSIPLTNFVLPYLIKYNSKDEVFLKALKNEFDFIFQYKKLFELRIFFLVFDVLEKWQIAPGSTHKRGSKWSSLDLANDYDLAVAALDCELYVRALHHFEIYMYENSIDVADYKQYFVTIYENIDDVDTLTLLNASNAYDNHISVEIDSLPKIEQPLSGQLNKCVYKRKMAKNTEINLTSEDNIHDTNEFIKNMLNDGRYERALMDAKALKSHILNKNIELDSIIAASAIRLNKWNELEKISQEYENYSLTNDCEIDYLMEITTCKVLYFLKERHLNEFKNELYNVRLLISTKLRAMTSFPKFLSILSKFRAFEEVEDACIDESSWLKELSIEDVEFVTAIRCALLDIFSKDNKKIAEQWLNLAKMSRKSELLFKSEMYCQRARHYSNFSQFNLQQSIYNLSQNPTINSIQTTAKSSQNLSINLKKPIQDNAKKSFQNSNKINEDLEIHSMADYEMAKIAYSKNKKDQALSLIKSIESQKDFLNNDLYGKLLYSHAKWSQETNEDISTVIQYYKESISNLLETSNFKILSKSYFQLAALADQRLMSFANSIEQNAVNSTQKRSSKQKFWNQSSPSDITSFIIDQVTMSLENYFLCIKNNTSYSYEVVPSILMLYFDFGKNFVDIEDKTFSMLSKNQKSDILQKMTEILKKYINEVDSIIWLNGITQIISRINQPDELKSILIEILTIAVLNFPQQSIWHLISVTNSRLPERIKAFKDLWPKIELKLDKDILRQFNKLDMIARELLQLCNYTPNTKDKTMSSRNLCPKLVDELRDCDVLMPLLSTLTNQVKDITIKGMSDTIVFLSSLQKPRKIEFKSNFKNYHYLCKKDEDLRKDMRMMEFASFINRLLMNDHRCRERNLRIVTYAVICLNESCGIMEWVENTESFRLVVTKMLNNQDKRIDMEKVRKVYIECEKPDQEIIRKKTDNFVNILLKKFPAVQHIWFLSHFKDVNQWFESRLLYTRSTALWSMVGYIIGLGDRHTENILLNSKTGSCVHVDFNLLFDRAKSLTVPETVPFRLTQNIVDGMGIMKTKGCFTEVSVLIMETFRSKKEKLISVLQTFVHDPLMEWRKNNKQVTENTVKLTLKEVERRIMGMTDDKTGFLSAECLVDKLISQATDPTNLAMMYIGWQSFL